MRCPRGIPDCDCGADYCRRPRIVFGFDHPDTIDVPVPEETAPVEEPMTPEDLARMVRDA
jgi:hypothetical protein